MNNLARFIVKAKRNTYASGKPPKKLEDGFEEFEYAEGDYSYRDRYYARDPNPFGGQEVVWKDKKPIWIMNYYGFVISEKIPNKEIYPFLRKAMSLVNEKTPFRGPTTLKEGKFKYVNNVSGNVNKFKGTEKILFNGKEVYQLDYHGGTL